MATIITPEEFYRILEETDKKMNANELADALVNTDYTPLTAECAAMLRQLQAENEELKADNARLKQFCWETDEAKQFLSDVRKAQEK